ncbi:AMIN domain-containing protein [Campylobacter concisus]|uniref:Periplasmic protein (AMIN domain) n=1 Tax=Campylobacter concisus (strain 13826) TaxID=360104 RepID=A7ZFN3_CAMC1|nr:AMIN domain-containing protein [Campylobacter concisus]EAT98474.1 putative periplasmic protein (AMIN domain) [Campylobacter concisus 13826]MBS5810583.1 AMIN domain-containing protein [Campylobacter concisus]
MKKIWLVLSILTASLCARENPFMPISELNTSVMTTNVVEKYDSFNSLSFKFPSDAMLLLDVTIRYRANDGSIKEKRLTDINKTIDWNDEFALSKMKNPEPVAAKKLDVSVTMAEVPAQKVSTPVIIEKNETKILNKDRNKTSDVPTPNVVVIDLGTKKAKEPAKPEQKVVEVKIEPTTKPVQEAKSSEKEVKFLGFISFLAHEKELNIITKAKNLKHFAYEKNKIVLDFAKPPRSFKTRNLKLENETFKNVIIGWHDKYFRVVLELDKMHKYKLETAENGYVLKLL